MSETTDREIALKLTVMGVIFGVPAALLAVGLVTNFTGSWWLALTLPAAVLIAALLIRLTLNLVDLWRGRS